MTNPVVALCAPKDPWFKMARTDAHDERTLLALEGALAKEYASTPARVVTIVHKVQRRTEFENYHTEIRWLNDEEMMDKK